MPLEQMLQERVLYRLLRVCEDMKLEIRALEKQLDEQTRGMAGERLRVSSYRQEVLALQVRNEQLRRQLSRETGTTALLCELCQQILPERDGARCLRPECGGFACHRCWASGVSAWACCRCHQLGVCIFPRERAADQLGVYLSA